MGHALPVEVAGEQPRHRDVLGEDQHRAVLGEDGADDLVEQVGLLRRLAERALLEEVGGVVADLLEAGEHREHQAAAGVLVGALDPVHRVADEGLVEDDLLPGQREQVVGVGARWQLRRDAGVGLAAAQQERRDQLAEAGRHRRVDARLDRRGPHPPEGLARAEEPRRRPVEQRPELGQLVLDGGAGQRDPGAAGDRAERAGSRRAGVLDVLGLVGDDEVPRHGRQDLGVDPHRAVGGQHEPGLGSGEAGEVAGRAVEAADGDAGGERGDLGLPVSEQGGRADHQRRAGAALALGAVEGERDQRDRLAETHVVGQARAEAERGQLVEPGQALALVVAQAGGKPGGHLDRRPVDRGQELVADLQQRGADDHLAGVGVGALDLRHAGERGRDRLGGRGRADQSLARLARQRRVDDRPLAAQPQHRRRRRGQLVHLLVGERVAVEGELPVEREQRVLGQHPGLERRLLGALAARPAVEHGRRRQVAAQAARPHHVDAAPAQCGDPAVEQADQLVGVEGDPVGHPELEQPVERRPRLGR